jgi:hypothetical protein
MNAYFNSVSRQVTLKMTVEEFDLLHALRFAAANYISPLTPQSRFYGLIMEIDKSAYDIMIERTKITS